MEMLTPSLQADSKIPLYQQLYTYIREEIRSGRLPHHTKLPSKRKLSAYLNISQNTIQASYDQLMAEGYIQSYEKRGFYVNQLEHLQNIRIAAESEDLSIKAEAPV